MSGILNPKVRAMDFHYFHKTSLDPLSGLLLVNQYIWSNIRIGRWYYVWHFAGRVKCVLMHRGLILNCNKLSEDLQSPSLSLLYMSLKDNFFADNLQAQIHQSMRANADNAGEDRHVPIPRTWPKRRRVSDKPEIKFLPEEFDYLASPAPPSSAKLGSILCLNTNPTI